MLRATQYGSGRTVRTRSTDSRDGGLGGIDPAAGRLMIEGIAGTHLEPVAMPGGRLVYRKVKRLG